MKIFGMTWIAIESVVAVAGSISIDIHNRYKVKATKTLTK